MKSTLCFLLAVVTAADNCAGETRSSTRPLSYRTTWVGNTFAGGPKWIQNAAESMHVLPDGTLVVGSFWDDGGREVGLYKDGDVVGQLPDTHMRAGFAVAASQRYFFYAHTCALENQPQAKAGEVLRQKPMCHFGVSRYTRDGKHAPFASGKTSFGNMLSFREAPDNHSLIPRGVAASATALVVADTAFDSVKIIDPETMRLIREFSAPRPGGMVVDAAGKLWVICDDGKRVARYTLDGVVDIEALPLPAGALPSGVGFDREGRLLVCDNGPLQQPRRISALMMQIVAALAAGVIGFQASASPLPKLKVSDNHRFLVTEDGQPFFWLGDTAWELFHRLDRDEAGRYLDNRAKNGFNIIQAVAIAELDGHTVPNAYGHLPLVDLDPTRPAVRDGESNDFWDHVDFIVDAANRRGMYVGFLPTWGRYWHDNVKDGKPLFTPDNARTFGEWLGKRYRDKSIVWILGGDRSLDNQTQLDCIRAMAAGLRAGDRGSHLITLHPPGGNGSSTWFHNDDWLDFNMRQNGHAAEFTGRYDQTRADYVRTPVKPVLDGEPIYEDHPISFEAKRLGHSTAADVRRPLYWDVFSGAFGHTYGHHSVWQMWTPDRPPVNSPLMPWFDAIEQPGAAQMQHAKHLMLSRPFLTRLPDDSMIVADRVETSVPGAGRYRFVATRDAEGSYAMVYAPVGRTFKVVMAKLSGGQIKAWWFNPRDGAAILIGEFPNTGERDFTPPDYGEDRDWVLVLDDAAKNYAVPGRRSSDCERNLIGRDLKSSGAGLK